ncbi:hypothetical protein BIY31_10675 [Gibbsiella quercinecans]|nr:hypothetical protein BIY31_10675 [Gibbsiella quercinecans]
MGVRILARQHQGQRVVFRLGKIWRKDVATAWETGRYAAYAAKIRLSAWQKQAKKQGRNVVAPLRGKRCIARLR